MTSTTRLVADIGGTNARFALLSAQRELYEQHTLPCADYPDIVAAVAAYLDRVSRPEIEEAAFAIANPILGDSVQMTNHHWAFSIEETRRSLGLKTLIFKNDLTALAMSVPIMPDADLKQLGGRKAERKAPLAVIAPGTGLGVSGLIPSGKQWIPLEGEGGHVSLSPGNTRECAILQHCWKLYEHVSAERFISGMGLQNLYKAVCNLESVAIQDLSPADISKRGQARSDDQCAEALAVFCGLLGSVAGDLVLTLGAYGGVYIGGGIVPRLGGYFETSPFRERFEAKGRFREHLTKVPAYVITAKNPALSGIGQALTLVA
jgi:glucokinase